MRQKKYQVKRDGNVIVFPGTIEKLIQQGLSFMHQENYVEAVAVFEQALPYESNHLQLLSSYAVALYETKDFEKAKEITSQLLTHEDVHYFDAMELYLSISIQLQAYDEVETTISALIDENLIPVELMKKFTYLRALNTRLWKRYSESETMGEPVRFTIEQFEAMSVFEQQEVLATLENEDVEGLLPIIVEIVHSGKFSPIIVTFALVLLFQANYSKRVMITKLGFQMDVVPAELTLPNQDVKTLEVLGLLEKRFEKDPTRFDMAKEIIHKYGIIMYPFGWRDYEVDEVTKGYEQYIESLMTGMRFPKSELNIFIKRIDNDLYVQDH